MGNYNLYKKHFSEYEDLKSQIVTRGNKLRYKFGKQLLTFLFFACLSCILWIFHSMGKTYTAPVAYTVKYTKLPVNKVIASDLPHRITLFVSSTGYKIIQERLYARFNHIELNVSSFMPYLVNNEFQSYYVFRSFDKKKVEEQLNNRVEIIDFKPDTLNFQFSDAVSRTVAIKPLLKLEFAKQFMQHGKTILKPDSIRVSGPSSILDTLQCINTEVVEVNDISGSTTKKATLKPIKFINYPFDDVIIAMHAERFTEVNLKIPVTIINKPDSLNVRLFPNEIDVSFHVCLSDHKKITTELFRFVVDYNEAIQPKQTQISVTPDKVPDFVSAFRYKQQNIEFIIEK